MSETEAQHWYAVKIFYNRGVAVNEELTEEGYETYLPITYQKTGKDGEGNPVYRTFPLASLMFIRTTRAGALELRKRYFGRFLFYDTVDDQGRHQPAVIPDREMELFRKVTSVEDPRLEYLAYNPSLYASGKKVRVIGGPFEGAEGVIKRIRHDRRFLIEMKGICLVATSYIPQSLLRPIDN